MKSFLLYLSLILSACHSGSKESKPVDKPTGPDSITHTSLPADGPLAVNRDSLLQDFLHWYNYTYYEMPLSQDFIPLRTDSSQVSLTEFLETLAAGKTVAFKIAYREGQPVYRLFPLSTTDESIHATIRQMALTEISHRKLEGQPIPDFDFTDLNGRHYDKTSTNGNLLVLKCWFVHCVACVKEFPELNRLVDSYPNRDDILFVSLAFDTGKELKNFLSNRQFKYAVVPDCKSFMENKLHTTEYPTHLLVDRQGIIRKVVNRIEELEPFLAREAGANRKSEGGNRKVFTADLPAGRQGNESAEFRGEKPTLKASAQPP